MIARHSDNEEMVAVLLAGLLILWPVFRRSAKPNPGSSSGSRQPHGSCVANSRTTAGPRRPHRTLSGFTRCTNLDCLDVPGSDSSGRLLAPAKQKSDRQCLNAGRQPTILGSQCQSAHRVSFCARQISQESRLDFVSGRGLSQPAI